MLSPQLLMQSLGEGHPEPDARLQRAVQRAVSEAPPPPPPPPASSKEMPDPPPPPPCAVQAERAPTKNKVESVRMAIIPS